MPCSATSTTAVLTQIRIRRCTGRLRTSGVRPTRKEAFDNAHRKAVAGLLSGVVNKVAADGAALDQALAWAEHLALTPAAQFVQIKTALSQGATDTLSEIFTAEKHNLLTRI